MKSVVLKIDNQQISGGTSWQTRKKCISVRPRIAVTSTTRIRVTGKGKLKKEQGLRSYRMNGNALYAEPVKKHSNPW
jgi:hypothetical protein